MKAPIRVPQLSRQQIELFWSWVDRRGPEECWPWKGYCTRHRKGGGYYGAWHIFVDGRSYYLRPSRVVHTLLIGPIPDGYTIDHVRARGCTNSLCCNPAHLEAVPHVENLRRTRGRYHWRRKSTVPATPVARSEAEDSSARGVLASLLAGYNHIVQKENHQ